MSFVVLTFFLLAVLLTWTTKLARDAKRNKMILKRNNNGKKTKKTTDTN
jgi:hypothetical protein